MTTDPTIAVLDPTDQNLDAYYIHYNRAYAVKQLDERIPVAYRDATVDVPEIRAWVTALVESARHCDAPSPHITTGPSLLILGLIGAGKTFQAMGAVRALAMSGMACGWELLTAADVYAKLRPRHRIDPEEEFHQIANTPLLVLDDLGAAKATEWTEEVNYRLINHRWQWRKPTIITSNVPRDELGAAMGKRVTSRLIEMAKPVIITGPDRRRTVHNDHR